MSSERDVISEGLCAQQVDFYVRLFTIAVIPPILIGLASVIFWLVLCIKERQEAMRDDQGALKQRRDAWRSTFSKGVLFTLFLVRMPTRGCRPTNFWCCSYIPG